MERITPACVGLGVHSLALSPFLGDCQPCCSRAKGRPHTILPAETWTSGEGGFLISISVPFFFFQMLINICSETQGLEGLLSGNELQSLMIATTCLREHSCSFWKEPTFCVLKAISKAQNLSVIQYLQGMILGDQGWAAGTLPTIRPWDALAASV